MRVVRGVNPAAIALLCWYSFIPESELWAGFSSQWIHFWYYLFCVVLAIGCP